MVQKGNPSETGEVHTSVHKMKQSGMNQYVAVNTQELQNAEMEIIKVLQREEFQEEMSVLHSNDTQQGSQGCNSTKVVKKTSTLYRLDPFLDEIGLRGFGGDLKHADLTTAVKHPVILPKKGHVTDLIISYYQDMVEHQGHGMTLIQIRSAGFWIIGAWILMCLTTFQDVFVNRN